MTGQQWVNHRRRTPHSPEPGLTCFLFPTGGQVIRWDYGVGGQVLFDKEGYDGADEDFVEPYMGYTPGEDDLPERGAWPGERYMA
jgi:hypothetical protein